MDHFQRRDGELYAEGVSLQEIADRFGTPTFVYARATITRHVRVLQEALADLDHEVCYAVKANGNLGLLELLNNLGCGFDAVSEGELARVLKAGGRAKRTIFSGVGKRPEEIERALKAGVLYLGVESAEELATVAEVAQRVGVRAPVALRVNPDVDAQTHAYIATGMKKNKFGVPWDQARDLYQSHAAHPHLELCGVTCHIGSQITQLAPFQDAAERMARLATDLQQSGVPLRYLGMGGGLGVPYGDEGPPSPQAYGEALSAVVKPTGLTLVLEPGRVIMGNAGVLLTRVVRRKTGADRQFVIVDAAMNDLLRPALYQAHHRMEVVAPRPGPQETVDVVGPVCESADAFARNLTLSRVEAGDALVLRTAGAYGFVMSSQYNGRPRAAEVLCDGDQSLLLRQRETVADLWRGEYGLRGHFHDTLLPRNF